jgi:GMP synthase (glutamine-hydrolysing)
VARALHIQNESTDPAGLFVDALERHGFTVDTLHPYAGDELPASLHGVDALVAGGGLVDTHQAGEHPWLAQEIELVREALAQRTPFMGLCLGAQVLTEAAGGTVYRCEPHEIGWHEVELTPAAAEDALFEGLPRRFQAMQWHYYACRPGNGAVELMTNPVSLQALRVGDAAWGTQFHIEVTRPVLLTWLEMGGDDLAANGYPRERFLESLDEHLETHQQVGRTLADRFARFATRPAG